MTDRDARHELLKLVVKWRDLAGRIDRFNSPDQAAKSEPMFPPGISTRRRRAFRASLRSGRPRALH
jgi:hypothetical protein